MQYAILITSQPANLLAVRQTVLTDTDSCFQRYSDGGRGTNNAWSAVPDVIDGGEEPLVGAIVAVPLTETDRVALANEPLPQVLFQKLTRAWQARQHEAAPYGTLTEAFEYAYSLVSGGLGLGEFHLDLRKVRVAKPAVAPVAVAAPVAPLPTASVQVFEPEPVSAMATLWYPSQTDPRVSSYIERTLAGGSTETEMYDFARANQMPVKLEGPAGTGKTSSATRYAALRGLPMVKCVGSVSTDVTDMLGSYRPDGRGNFPWVDGVITMACRQPSVILFNEVNFLPARMASIVMSILEERHFTLSQKNNEVVEVHPETLIVADMNPGYRGTSPLNEALNDRLTLSLEFDYDNDIESKVIPSKALLELARDMRNRAIEGTFDAPVSTRMLKSFCQIATGLSLDFAIETFVNKFSSTEERGAARNLLETYRFNIAEDLGIAVDTVAPSFVDEATVTPDFAVTA